MNVWDFKNELDLIVMASTNFQCSYIKFGSHEDGKKDLSYTFFYHNGEKETNDSIHVYERDGKPNENELREELALELEKLFPTKKEEITL